MSDKGYSFFIAEWEEYSRIICALREQVYFTELDYPGNFFDGLDDEDDYHLVVKDYEGNPIATGSMKKNGHINYIAILSPWRGMQIGGSLLNYMAHIGGALKLDSVWAETPTELKHFMEKYLFSEIVQNDEICEPHCRMVRHLRQPGVVH